MKFKKVIFGSVAFLIAGQIHAAVPESADSFSQLYNQAKNQNLSMTERWKSLLSAADVANGDEVQKIIDFSNDKDWFMRNASMVALDKMGNDLVYDQAKKLISDKALVVRSAAVDYLSRLNSEPIRSSFEAEMSKPYNFAGKKSLWVRSQIMKYLVKYANKDQKEFFIKSLHDFDGEVAYMSTQALEKIMNVRFEGQRDDVIKKWKEYSKSL